MPHLHLVYLSSTLHQSFCTFGSSRLLADRFLHPLYDHQVQSELCGWWMLSPPSPLASCTICAPLGSCPPPFRPLATLGGGAGCEQVYLMHTSFGFFLRCTLCPVRPAATLSLVQCPPDLPRSPGLGEVALPVAPPRGEPSTGPPWEFTVFPWWPPVRAVLRR